MNTESILTSLNMAAVSKNGIPSRLLLDIAEALQERDALREDLKNTAWARDMFEAQNKARFNENLRLIGKHYEVLKERDALRADREAKVEQWHEAGARLMECAEAITHLRRIVDDTLAYCETADAIIAAERWLRKMDGEAQQ